MQKKPKQSNKDKDSPEGELYLQRGGFSVRCVYIASHTWSWGICSKHTPLFQRRQLPWTWHDSRCGSEGSDVVQVCVLEKNIKAACHPLCNQYTNSPWSLGSWGCQQCHWCGSSACGSLTQCKSTSLPGHVSRGMDWSRPCASLDRDPRWPYWIWYHAEGCCDEISCHRAMQTF